MAKPQTRAQVLGVKPGALQAKTLRKVDRVEKLLREISAPWEDVDSAIEMAVDDLLSGPLAELRKTIADSIEILREPEGDY
jgi:hypothetical protein